MIKSPLNYIGGKYKLLTQILPLFPEHINTYVDLFAGGLDVSINVDAQRVICNDINVYVIDLYRYFQQTSIEDLLRDIEELIAKYKLSKQNREGYNLLREDYNNTHSSLLLFLLICYGFNHQLRFNSKGEFNNPFGVNRSSYNVNIERNLRRMHRAISQFEYYSLNFREFDLDFLEPGDFLYADPPYLISCGSYNDGKRGFEGWSVADDALLMEKMMQLDERGVNFAMSNVVQHKGAINEQLLRWADNFNIHHLNADYSNSNYQSKSSFTDEVLITDY